MLLLGVHAIHMQFFDSARSVLSRAGVAGLFPFPVRRVALFACCLLFRLMEKEPSCGYVCFVLI